MTDEATNPQSRKREVVLTDPEKIRENMRRLANAPAPSKQRSNPPSKPMPIWDPLPGDDLPEIRRWQKQERLARAIPSANTPELAGTVYVIQDIQSRLYKIGRTTNLQRRMKELGVGSTARLISSKQVSNAAEVERRAHQRYKSARLPQTEYFKLDRPPMI